MIGCFFYKEHVLPAHDEWFDIALSYLTPFKTADVYAMRIRGAFKNYLADFFR